MALGNREGRGGPGKSGGKGNSAQDVYIREECFKKRQRQRKKKRQAHLMGKVGHQGND